MLGFSENGNDLLRENPELRDQQRGCYLPMK
jgi:hypothetical protein